MEMNVMGDILHLLLLDIVNKATLLLHHRLEYVEDMWVLNYLLTKKWISVTCFHNNSPETHGIPAYVPACVTS